MSNPVSWAKEKLSSTPKQGTFYKPHFIFESDYYSRAGYNRGTKRGTQLETRATMSNLVSWAKEKLSSTPKQGTFYKPHFIFESDYYSRAGYNRGTKRGTQLETRATMSNLVSRAKEKLSSTPKQGTVYKPRFIFESG